MAHKRARKSGRSTSPESQAADASPPPVAQKSDDDSSVVEISPPPKKKVKKVAPGSPGFNSLLAVSISTGLKSSLLLMGKRLTFGSIKPDAPSPKAMKTDLQSPLSITKDKRVRRPSAKAVYMADSEGHSSDAESNIASPSKKSFTPASATASSSIGLHKGKGQPTDARSPSPATSGEEDRKLTPKAKPSVKLLSKGATPLRHRQLEIVSESEPDVV
ncbi:hypothetical protein GALMADRAFT_144523 [Galerina marginata CBS 339.88]|uniref:Uncharacterized protein n=1 Tax=Galerina marginata (strain CBS 339.88) TaxID=685588 RepID=A0A067SSG3_GALM3|nr:hypothetical protein GALMADRAFT_144523 [Galerina marginata CBS 339.88]